VERRPDVLVFSSEPFTAHIDLAGPIRAEIQVGSSAPSMHVIVRVIDVFPDGRTRRIRDGAALVRCGGRDTHAVVDLGHTGYRIRDGHRLRVQIASSDFPRYLPYFGDDRNPWTATTGIPNEHRLRVGGSHASRIVLTTI
jgi:putative CocE/NonD family hydrolase